MKFSVDLKKSNALKLHLNTRIRNTSAINKVFNTQIYLPHPKAFSTSTLTIDLSFYNDHSQGLLDQKKLDQVVTGYRSNIDELKSGSINFTLFKLRLDGHIDSGSAKDYIINHPSVVKGGRADKYKRYEYSFNKWKECFKVDANFTDINSKNIREFADFINENYSRGTAPQHIGTICSAARILMLDEKIPFFMIPPKLKKPMPKRAHQFEPFDREIWFEALDEVENIKELGALLFFIMRYCLAGPDLGDMYFIKEEQIKGETRGTHSFEVIWDELKLAAKMDNPLPNYWLTYLRSKTEDKILGTVHINISNLTTLECIHQWNHLNAYRSSPFFIQYAKSVDSKRLKGEQAQALWGSGLKCYGFGARNLNKKIGIDTARAYGVNQRTARHYLLNTLNEMDVPISDRRQLAGHGESGSQSNYTRWSKKIALRLDKALFEAIEVGGIPEMLEAWKTKSRDFLEVAPAFYDTKFGLEEPTI